LTRYLEALRQHRQKLSNLNGELEQKINGPKPDRQTVIDLGGKAQAVAADFQKTLKAFAAAETRRGLLEEVDLFIDSAQVLNQLVGRYQQLAGIPVIPLQKNSLVSVKSNMVRTIFKLAREKYASRLESEGLRDILTSESWNEVLDKAAYHSQRKLDEFLERETAKLFGFGFHDAESARRALRMQMRREICRQVAKLLVKITSNAIVIEIVAGPIIRWIESDLIPKLREALRQKGNLPERLARSIETMKNAGLDLNKLPCDAKLRVVAMRLNAAAGVLHATRYLERDLGNQWGDDLFKLAAEKENLARTIKMTRLRFLLVRDDYEDELEFADSEVGQLLKNLQAAIFTVQGSAAR
jgi:regulator of replication initiation timing